MNLEEIEELIEMLEDTDISELDIEEDNFSIRIKKGGEQKVVSHQAIAPESAPRVQQPVSEDNKQVNKGKDELDKNSEAKNKQQEGRQEIEAPMVGTFYRAPAPDAAPFVEVGDVVQEEDTLCIIEAMKLMNEIEAETKGKIVDILVDDGEAVEYGQPIFLIEDV